MTTTLARPVREDAEVINAAVEAIWPALMKWLEEEEPYEDLEEEECAKQKFRKTVTTNAWNWDGFKLANSFVGDDGDSELVHILDKFSFHVDRCHKDLVKQWVLVNDIETQYALGDQVEFETIQPKTLGVKSVKQGSIVRVDSEIAVYTINVPQDGHCTPISYAEDKVKFAEVGGTLGYYVPAEAVLKKL